MGPKQRYDIRLKYLIVGETSFRSIALDPEEYWEESSEGGTRTDAVPRFNHAVEYLSEPTQVRRTELQVVDRQEGRWRAVVETFWDEGRSRVIEVSRGAVDSTGGGRVGDLRFGDYYELIVDVVSGKYHEMLRYGSVGQERGLILHTRVHSEADGQAERGETIYSLRSDAAALQALKERQRM